MLYLVDTCVLSDLAKPSPNARTLRAFTEHLADVRLASISVHEIRYGIERLPDGKRKEMLSEAMDMIMGGVAILPYDAPASAWHAVERARLAKKGEVPSFVDGQIAAIAAVNECQLITSNVKDFRGFDLRVARWG